MKRNRNDYFAEYQRALRKRRKEDDGPEWPMVNAKFIKWFDAQEIANREWLRKWKAWA